MDNNFHYIHDESIKGGSTRLRPDFYLTRINKDFNVILEVDENQHRYGHYTRSSQNSQDPEIIELHRMVKLFFDMKKSNNLYNKLLFIRYNPHKFRSGLSTLPSRMERMKVLKKFILSLQTKILPYRLSVIYFFYDNYPEDCNIKPIGFEKTEDSLKISFDGKKFEI